VLPFFFRFGSADICRCEFERVGEFSGEGRAPAEQVNLGRTWAPVLLVKESDARRVEFLFMIEQALTEQVNGIGGVCEAVEEVRGGHQ